MFESAVKPIDRWRPIHFLIQQFSVPLGISLADYYIFAKVDRSLGERFGLNTEVEAWRWFTVLSLIALGFGAGYLIQTAWKKAYLTARLIWILPTLFYIWTLITSMTLRPAHASFEMMIGAIGYSLGAVKARQIN
jgi:hypothetical protein